MCNPTKQKGPLVQRGLSQFTVTGGLFFAIILNNLQIDSMYRQSLRVLLRKTHLPLHKGGLERGHGSTLGSAMRLQHKGA